MPKPPRHQHVGQWEGSSREEIEQEPSWGQGHNHRIGVRNKDNRIAGITRDAETSSNATELEEVETAIAKHRELRREQKAGKLLNFQDIMKGQTDFAAHHQSRYPPTWRFVINASEDWVKNGQDWPANIEARKKKEAKEKQEKQEKQKDQSQEPQRGDGANEAEKSGPRDGKGTEDKTEGKEQNASQDSKKQGYEDNAVESHNKTDGRSSESHQGQAGAGHEQQKQSSAGQEKNKPAQDKQTEDEHSKAERRKGGPGEANEEQHTDEDDPQFADKMRDCDSSTSSSELDDASSGPESTLPSSDGEASEDNEDEDDWRHNRGHDKSDKHNPAYGFEQSKADADEEYKTLREKFTPQEIALLRTLQHEKDYIAHLEQNDGAIVSPVRIKDARKRLIGIDKQDTMTPDNWIARSPNLIRHTGQHPLNAEPRMKALFEAGIITPNELHYVRNHGSVPRLFWETHKLDIQHGKMQLSMDDIADKFEPINIAFAMACDGTRRAELNMLKKSKGFKFVAPVSNAYWKGAPLHEVLLAAGFKDDKSKPSKRLYVHFEGADELSEGKYATSIPFDYVMDPQNDVILAYEMNNTPLPADHGFPLRLLVPGFVGGRNIKWLAKIWVSDKENTSHYHVWDNRVLPSFITEKDGKFAQAMFKHPDTACYEQNLQSIIARPAQDERLDPTQILRHATYRIEGIAYHGGGHIVQRVEVSLDEGVTWLYAVRKFPERPVRHGSKFWSWCHWHVDVDSMHFLRAESIVVRAHDVFKNTQPAESTWNVLGMMQNSWYRLKLVVDPESKHLIVKHPVDPEGDGGWMKQSTENQLAAAKQSSGVPAKEFTRQEVEKHDKKDDCWLVINENVYDVASVLDWHPGGAAAILALAGKVNAEATTSFESIHDEYAHKKLQETAIGKVTDKAAQFIREQAKAAAAETAKSDPSKSEIVLNAQRWTPVTLSKKDQVSKDTFRYTFNYKDRGTRSKLGLGTCQHIEFGINMKDKMLVRQYTPTKPILASEDDGTIELVVKTYFPDENQPGGAFSNILHLLDVGEQVNVSGPSGDIEYKGKGKFVIEGKEVRFSKVNLILGGSGITPGFQLIARVVREKDDETEIRVVDANKTEGDILLKDEMDELVQRRPEQVKITHVLSHPSDEWQGRKGHVNADIIRAACFEPGDGVASFLCGPPGMIQKAAVPALQDWGFEDEKDLFGF